MQPHVAHWFIEGSGSIADWLFIHLLGRRCPGLALSWQMDATGMAAENVLGPRAVQACSEDAEALQCLVPSMRHWLHGFDLIGASGRLENIGFADYGAPFSGLAFPKIAAAFNLRMGAKSWQNYNLGAVLRQRRLQVAPVADGGIRSTLHPGASIDSTKFVQGLRDSCTKRLAARAAPPGHCDLTINLHSPKMKHAGDFADASARAWPDSLTDALRPECILGAPTAAWNPCAGSNGILAIPLLSIAHSGYWLTAPDWATTLVNALQQFGAGRASGEGWLHACAAYLNNAIGAVRKAEQFLQSARPAAASTPSPNYHQIELLLRGSGEVPGLERWEKDLFTMMALTRAGAPALADPLAAGISAQALAPHLNRVIRAVEAAASIAQPLPRDAV